MDVLETVKTTMAQRGMAGPENPVILMVSGGSDSTALAYIAAALKAEGLLESVVMLHLNHRIRPGAADEDAHFVQALATILDLQLISVSADIPGICNRENGNLEAVARRVRYEVARDGLALLCSEAGCPEDQGRIFVAHSADDRVENFYMRSIVGTGPGGFRSMYYRNGAVERPLMDLSRQDLRAYIHKRADEGLPVARTPSGELWCEDATNNHTDHFRAYVRHEIVPLAKERNPQLLTTLGRAMNAIADEDDMLDAMARNLFDHHVHWLEPNQSGCVIAPALGIQPKPLQRRVVVKVLEALLEPEARLEYATIDTILQGYTPYGMNSGFVANIQGNLAVSVNKAGIRIEPMAAFRTRRHRI